MKTPELLRDRTAVGSLRERAGWRILLGGLCAAFAAAAIAATARVDNLIKAATSLDANPKRGATLYYDQCQGCHGTHAEGDAGNVVPSLAGQRQLYLVKQLADFVELERESPEMHRKAAVAGLDAPQAIIDVAAYLNAQPVLQQPQTGDGSLRELGEGMFREQCASCHGDDARGDEDGSVPSLRNQHYSYLLQQMRKIGAGHRADIDLDLARFLESLDGEELAGVADYLSRLRGPVPDRRRMRSDGSVSD